MQLASGISSCLVHVCICEEEQPRKWDLRADAHREGDVCCLVGCTQDFLPVLGDTDKPFGAHLSSVW